jgi:hypothetical protein
MELTIPKAVIRAAESASFDMLHPCIRAMTFFGIPHRSMLIDDILQRLGETSPARALIESLAISSAELRLQWLRFIPEATNIKIFVFKEAKRVRKMQQVRPFSDIVFLH